MQKPPYYASEGPRVTVDQYGRPLPPLPQKPFLKAAKQYAKGTVFELQSRDENVAQKAIKITVLEPLDVGYGKVSQSVKARVDEGPRALQGNIFFVKFYDQLYISPEDLFTEYTFSEISVATNLVDPPSPTSSSRPDSSSSSSNDSMAGRTLAGSAELNRADLKKPTSEAVCLQPLF
jgi:hypothetical protein